MTLNILDKEHWVSQVHLGFSGWLYGKTHTNLLDNPINCWCFILPNSIFYQNVIYEYINNIFRDWIKTTFLQKNFVACFHVNNYSCYLGLLLSAYFTLCFLTHLLNFPGGSVVKNPPANLGSVPGLEDPLEKEIATHSSILAWEISWKEEPGVLQFTMLQRVGPNWACMHTLTFLLYYMLIYNFILLLFIFLTDLSNSKYCQ